MAAVILEAAINLGALAYSLLTQNWLVLPSVLLRIALVGILSLKALQGREWARWLLFFQVLIFAVVEGVFGLWSFPGGVRVEVHPVLLAVAAVHLIECALIARSGPQSVSARAPHY